MAVSTSPINMHVENVQKVLDCAKAYLEDARYYREKKKFEVSLASVAYCEGLLDALKLLGVVSFEWPRKVRETRREK
jgi:FAD synthetase